MAAIYLPEDVQAVVDAEALELKLSGAAECFAASFVKNRGVGQKSSSKTL